MIFTVFNEVNNLIIVIGEGEAKWGTPKIL